MVLLQAVGAQNLTPLTFATVTPRVGDLAIAVAHTPFSPVTLSTGTISSVGVTITLTDNEPVLRDVLTVDATPDSRQDGAPLLNGNGDVIGVVVDAGGAAPGVVALSMSAASELVAAATGSGGSAAVPNLGADSEVIDPGDGGGRRSAGRGAHSLGCGRRAGCGGGADRRGRGHGRGQHIDRRHPSLRPHHPRAGPDQQVALTVYRDGTTRSLELLVGSG